MDSKQEIPEDLRNRHEEMVMQATSNFPPEMSGIGPEEAATLIERIASLEAALKERQDQVLRYDKAHELLQSQLTEARSQVGQARKTGEYWKAEHLAANKVIDNLRDGIATVIEQRNKAEAQLEAVTGKVTDGNE